MALTADQVKELAELLFNAEQSSDPVPPLTDRFPDMTDADAYEVQQEVIRKRIQGGRRVVGKKVGLTSLAMQQMLGVGEPDYGVVLDDMTIADGSTFEAARLLQPRVEPEIAFILERGLKGPGVTAVQVLAATRFVVPAIEIIDSRVRDWKIKLCDTIADNASSARIVLGNAPKQVHQVDLRLVGMVLEKNGEVVQTGAGAAALGHPANAVAWLANAIGAYGVALEPGEVIMPGAVSGAVDVARGDHIRVSFDGLGTVSARFV